MGKVCGTPYNLMGETPEIDLKDEWIPVYKKYWEETHGCWYNNDME